MDGFTEAKIEKFGEEFINVIRILCPPSDKKTLREILIENPMKNAKFIGTVELSYNIYKNGKSIDDIAVER